MHDIVIELDLERDQAATETPRPRSRMHAAKILGVLVALSIVGGAEVVQEARVQQIAEIRIDTDSAFIRAGDNLVIAGSDDVTAYDFATGAHRWTVAPLLESTWLWHKDNLLLISGINLAHATLSSQRVETVAVDPSTGRSLWQLMGYVEVAGSGDDAVLVAHHVDHAQPDLGTTVSFHRPDSTLLWAVDPGADPFGVDLSHKRAAKLNRTSGELVEHDLSGGAVVRRSVLPAAVGGRFIWYQENALMVADNEGRTLRFDAASLVRLPDQPDGPQRQDCGVVWCQPDSQRSGYVELKDKVTGEKIFETQNWFGVMPTEGGVLGLAQIPDDSLVPLVSFFHPLTRKEIDLSRWSAVNIGFGEGPGDLSGDPIYLRTATAGRTFFGTVDRRGFRVIGSVPRTEIRLCLASGDLLACQVGLNLVRIWRLT